MAAKFTSSEEPNVYEAAGAARCREGHFEGAGFTPANHEASDAAIAAVHTTVTEPSVEPTNASAVAACEAAHGVTQCASSSAGPKACGQVYTPKDE